jgi:hypothetical protein
MDKSIINQLTETQGWAFLQRVLRDQLKAARLELESLRCSDSAQFAYESGLIQGRIRQLVAMQTDSVTAILTAHLPTSSEE